MQKFNLHVVGLPHAPTTRTHSACAYTAKVYKFCKMMTDRGHRVFHYGIEGSDPVCAEHIDVMKDHEYRRFFGEHDYTKFYYPIVWDPSYPYWVLTINRTIAELQKRIKPGDFLCLIAGSAHAKLKTITQPLGVITVEYGIGYYGTFCDFKVYESYSHMHNLYGIANKGDGNGNFFDAVIPNYFDLADFSFNPKPSDYFLFMGRMIQRKGLQIVFDIASRIDKRVLLCGQGVLKVGNGELITTEGTYKITPNVEFVGYADVQRRNELMGNAVAIFTPTIYIEPFGGVAVEAQLCGTPAITTDWGAFTETVVHGVTGFRCRTLEQFVWATKEVAKLDRTTIHQRAASLYSLEKVGSMFDEYFSMLTTLRGKGWYEDRARTELNWLNK